MKHKSKWMVLCVIPLIVSLVAGVYLWKNQRVDEPAKTTIGVETLVQANNMGTSHDVILVSDNSGSMWNQQELRDAALNNVAQLAVGGDIRIGGVYFGNEIYKTLELTDMESQEGMETVLSFLHLTEQREDNRGTNIGLALEAAEQLLENQSYSRKKSIILFSDGINENVTGDPAYKAKADQKTQEVVQRLREKGVEIYCIYLHKNREDQNYLKQIVNYFEQGDVDYSYSRFRSVEATDSETLSAMFTDIFYSVQNGMKYSEIRVDASGEMNFYVPDLGVEKIQINLKGVRPEEINVIAPSYGENTSEIWEYGGNLYITITEPAIGGWKIQTKEGVKGTLAYYTNVYLEIERTGAENTNGVAVLNQEQYVRFILCDSQHAPISNNGEYQVAGCVMQLDENNVLTPVQELTFSRSGDYFLSNPFSYRTEGEYYYKVMVEYEDFVNLQFYVYEGEVSEMTAVTQAKEREVDLMVTIIPAASTALLIGILYLMYLWNYKRSFAKSKEQIHFLYQHIVDSNLEVKKQCEVAMTAKEAFDVAKEDFENQYQGVFEKEFLELLDKHQILVSDEADQVAEELKTLKAKMKTKKADAEKAKGREENVFKERSLSHLAKQKKELRMVHLEMADIYKWFSDVLKKTKDAEKKMKLCSCQLSALEMDVETMKNHPVTSTLHVKKPGYLGSRKGGQDICYSLGDVKLYTPENQLLPLREIQDGNWDIYITEYQKEEETGLLLRSKYPFSIKNANAGTDMKKVKQAILVKGEQYRLEVNGMKELLLEVR